MQESLKISNFPSSFTESDFKRIFGYFVNIQWIHDTECVITFKDSQSAKKAFLINANNPNVKIEVHNDTTMYNAGPRPIATDIVAKRLVAGALGIKVKKEDCPKLEKAIRNKEQLEEEYSKRQQELNDAWEE